MKKLMLVLLSVIATGFVSAQAEARSIKAFVDANLDQFNVQPESYLSRKEISSARILVNLYGERVITLTVNFKNSCPPGRFCAAVMPQPLEVTVPLQKTETGGCGETIYSGAIDQHPVDGIRQALTVVDNSRNTCKYYLAIPMTEVVYEAEGGRPQFSERHTMAGEKLH